MEVERKFLVTLPIEQLVAEHRELERTDRTYHYDSDLIVQSYVRDTGSVVVRRRRVDPGHHRDSDFDEPAFYVAIKKRVTDVTSIEVETQVEQEEYDALAQFCGPELRKVRHTLLFNVTRNVSDVTIWQVDEFLNEELNGLVLAEMELENEDDEFLRPHWLGREVTAEHRYRNYRLVRELKENA